MFKKILETIGTRYLIAALNLVLIVINAKVLGAEGVGLVGILVASVNIAVVVCGLFSGNTLVYFMNRYPVRLLFPVAYIWSVAGAFLACFVLWLTGLIPKGYVADVFILALLNSLVIANARFLLGKDRVKAFNMIHVLQGGLLLFVLLFFYFVLDRPSVRSYLWGSYIVNGIAFITGLFWVSAYLKEGKGKEVGKSRLMILKEMFLYGLWASADNLAENLITRLNYFLMQRFGGLGSVGLLDAGTKVSESVWHVSRSVSLIEYQSVAATRDNERQRRITLRLFKFTLFALMLVMGCILCIPERIYTDILFSPEFQGIRRVIAALSVGIVAFGCNNILSHYFIGSGRIRYSAYCSGTGLFVLAVVAPLLIARWGIVGAAVSGSVAFVTMLFFSLVVFIRQTGTRITEFLPTQEDWRFLCKVVGTKKRGNSNLG